MSKKVGDRPNNNIKMKPKPYDQFLKLVVWDCCINSQNKQQGNKVYYQHQSFLVILKMYLYVFLKKSTYLFLLYMLFYLKMRITKKLSQSLILFLFMVVIPAQSAGADYNNQDGWLPQALCVDGAQQSPIDIDTKSLNFCPNLTYNLKFQCLVTSLIPKAGDTAYTVPSVGTSYVGINDQIPNTTNAQYRLYSAAQYHFHAPSEHTINGVQYPMQIHVVHFPLTNSDGANTTLTNQFATFTPTGYNNQTLFASVAGFLFYPSDDPNAIDLNFQTDSNGTAQINHQQLFGCTTSRFFYHYRGSLTTPPCTESVDWFLYREPLPLKTSEYNALKSAINSGHSNARSVKQLKNRKVYLTGPACSAS